MGCPPRTIAGCPPPTRVCPGPFSQFEEGVWGEYGSYYPEAYDEGSGWDAGYEAFEPYADQWGYYDEPYGDAYGYEEAQGPENQASEMTDENGIMYAFEYDESWFADSDD